MPYAQPSFRRPQSPQERPLVFGGATFLAALAGFINVVVLGYFHVPVSHMSGAVSRLSIDVASSDRGDIRVVLSIVGGFLLGAVLSGMIIGGRKFTPGRRYGVTLLCEGGTLAAATVLLRSDHALGVALAAMACGIQNSMASSYYGLVIRTTHVTGIVTDIGVMVGHFLRHRRVRAWKLLLLVGILGGFFLGGIAGAMVSARVGADALWIPSAACVIAGSLYYLWTHKQVRAHQGRVS
jgi:uncharacterized membrane protein YoaK (UPF0700 family)